MKPEDSEKHSEPREPKDRLQKNGQRSASADRSTNSGVTFLGGIQYVYVDAPEETPEDTTSST